MSPKSKLIGLAAVGFIVTGLTVTGCSTSEPVPGQVPSATATATTAPTATAAVPTTAPGGSSAGPSASGTGNPGIDHVVIIVEENEPASNILGNGSAPYINKLADEYALATNYQAVTHPSLPNYLAMTSGTNAGITDDCSPGDGCTARVPNITDAIERSGRSWKMYAEAMPAPCTADDSGRYAVRHNPFMYYPGVTGDKASCASHVVPLSRLAEDLKSASGLPNYVFISPDLCNDMHDCPVATGDAWLSKEVPRILASPAFTTQNSLLVVTWDEGEGKNNTVPAIFAGPAARKSYKSDRAYNHYSLLRTIEGFWGLEPLTENDRNAPAMGDMLK